MVAGRWLILLLLQFLVRSAVPSTRSLSITPVIVWLLTGILTIKGHCERIRRLSDIL